VSRPVLSLLLLVALATPSEAASDLLVRITSSRQRVAYSGEQVVATAVEGGTRLVLARVDHDPTVGTRVAYRPLAGRGERRVVVHTPTQTVEYEPHTRRGRVYRSYDLDVPLTEHVDWLVRNYSVSSRPTRVLGRPAVRLRLLPKQAGRPRTDLRVDEQTGVILRSERVSADGRAREFTTFLSFSPRPTGWMRSLLVPADLQLWQEPTVEVASPEQVRRLFGHPLPEFHPPAGFQPVTAYLLDRAGPAVRRVYSDGLATLLLSLRPGRTPEPPVGSKVVRRPGGLVWLLPAGMRSLVHWTREGWSLTVVADLSPEVLLEIADRTGVGPPPTVLEGLADWFRSALGILGEF
jgi:negative regulator of sigma E activity